MTSSSILATTLLAAGLAPQEGPYVVGQPLPDLRLPTLDGSATVDLADLRGSRVLLVEFASW